MSGWLPGLAAAIAVFAATTAATRLILGWLTRRDILDHPNERSSHTRPTPRGGGLAVAPVALLAWVVMGPNAPWAWTAAAGAAALVVASWIDDRHSLPVAPRFVLHAAVVGAGLWALPTEALVFQGWLPAWLDRAVAGLGWLWFLNLYNFMDGIDGITGVETASLGVGVAVVAAVAGASADLIPLGLALAAAGLGFLVWNWHPARIFLGDSGSIPLGFLLGCLLIQLAIAGHLGAAVILPAYYLADATITILRRAARGEKVWQAHRQHFYQRAAHAIGRHDRVTLAIAGSNAVLMIAAVAVASEQPWLKAAGTVVAGTAVTALLGWMAVQNRRPGAPAP